MHMPTMRWAAAALAGFALAACATEQSATTSSATQPASPAASTSPPAGTSPASPAASTSPASPAASTSPASPVRAGGALCRDTAAVTRLVVTRVSTLPQNHPHFAVPAGVTITDPATARGVAEAICGLPAAPHGVMLCPADFGVSYRLSFAAGRAAFPVVTVMAGGCGRISGAGPARQADSATFWIDLAKALGVAHPTSTTLQGG